MDKEIESLKSKYRYKNISLPEGKFIDISIQVPITEEVKSYGKEKLDFFLKSIYHFIKRQIIYIWFYIYVIYFIITHSWIKNII
jgi:hypothetical protein